VEYTFTEPDGTSRRGLAIVGTDWAVPANGKVAVRYTPGKDGNSRLSGHVRWFGIILFSVGLLTILFFGVKLYREANEDTQPKRRKS
jgi:hypothetical protein